MKNNIREKIYKNKKGFTLVELIVVSAIMMIILAGSTVALLGWIDWSQYKKQQEAAQQIFMAAQNQLTEYQASGMSDVVTASVKKDDGNYENSLDIELLTSPEGNKYNMSSIWKESNDKLVPAKYQDTICYVQCDKGDYAKYIKGEEISQEAKTLFQIVGAYIADPDILNAAISLEISPENGQVFSALYSSHNNRLVYGETSTKGEVNICDRQESYCRDHMVGYYGVDILTKATKASTEKPVISNLLLNNEETLNLSFNLTQEKEATQLLGYEVTVCDQKTKNPVLTIFLDGTKIKNKTNAEPVSCSVKRYVKGSATGESESLGNLPIPAWIDKDQTVHVVLDAADLEASSIDYNANYAAIKSASVEMAKKYMNTFSFTRFGVDADNIYCTIQASGENYKPSDKKQSNAEATYFGTCEDTTTQKECKIKNARHLYNIRYFEDTPNTEELSKKIDYTVSQNISWNSFTEKGNLYQSDGNGSGQVVTDGEFPSIYQIRAGHSLDGEGHVIDGLTISQKANAEYNVYKTTDINISEGTAPTGFVLTNKGTIKKLTLDNISVTGTSVVGAFCAKNFGTVTELETANSKGDSCIVGENTTNAVENNGSSGSNIGGIMGLQASSEGTVCEKLVNRARVEGASFVGGIVGKLQTGDDQKIIVNDCRNYGGVKAADWTQKREAKYFGGIVGCAVNATKVPENLIIKNCISSPQYSEEEISSLLSSEEEQEKQLHGVYVGGIVGYNFYGMIENCSTEAEKGKKGYVIGCDYVGGIVGYNQGPASGIIGGDVDENGETECGVNETNVFGVNYVGGITGCNADIQMEEEYTSNDISQVMDTFEQQITQKQQIQPSSKRNLNIKIDNWINKGVIYAKKSYAGGITGYNTGWIFHCNSKVEKQSGQQAAQTCVLAENCDYVGGIAGYNNGIIGNTEHVVISKNEIEKKISQSDNTLSALCYIAGKNYIGGIVGYNDSDAMVEDYQLSGGFINGNGVFVGGYAGLNCSIDLLMSSSEDGTKTPRVISSNPNEVSGKYMVGGSIGGNVLKTTDDLKTVFSTNNFLGKISADAFCGGFIGYNLMYSQGNSAEIVKKLAEDLTTSSTDDVDKTLKKVVNIAETVMKDSDIKKTDAMFTITSEDGQEAMSRMGSITGKIYLGGIMGYNDDKTKLYVSNVVNNTPITAQNAIENEEEQENQKDYKDEPYKYSYIGGIIGKVSENVVLDNCRNAKTGDVVSVGTYVGGLCEINEGQILNCQVSSLGNRSQDYVGGICGLNKKQGMIKNTVIQKKTISGNRYVAGVVSENYGTVESGDITSVTVVAEDGYGAVIAAKNYKDGILRFQQEQTKIKGELSGNGNHMGMLAGYNCGSVLGKKTQKTKNAVKKGVDENTQKIYIEGSVEGAQNIGGAIGTNEAEQNVQNIVNKATITATKGNAGGIAGYNESEKAAIQNCENRGVVSATKKGNAGGITSVNKGSIENCRNIEVVKANNGNCGGITAQNEKNAKIVDCVVTGGQEKQLEFSAMNVIGGICAVNYGSLQANTVNYVNVFNMAKSGKSHIGGMTGKNYGIITLPSGKNAIFESSAKTYTDESLVGGVAGTNAGTITADAWTDSPTTIVECEVGFASNNSGSTADFGGAAGYNTGVIENIAVSSDITGKLGSEMTGTGGIAGRNNGTEDKNAEIRNCTYDGNVYVVGSGANVMRAGGISGQNLVYGKIEGCRVGCFGDAYILAGEKEATQEQKQASFVYLGGIAGANYGEILSCDSAGKDNENSNVVEVLGYAGMVGGITGYNYPGATVSGKENQPLTTGKNWTVTTKYTCNDAGLGGIIGYNASEKNIEYTTNNAKVQALYITNQPATYATGGFIGRSENKTVAECLIKDCVNNGEITGNWVAGGFVGRAKFLPFHFINCINYGTVTANQDSAGGILCGSYYISRTGSDGAYGNNLIFDNCENHGKIICKGSYAGGIFGKYEDSSEYVYINNCVNTGNISLTGNNAAGISATDSNMISLYQCRNYAPGLQCGIVKGDAASVKYCFDMSGKSYPISEKNLSANKASYNFYINSDSRQEDTEELAKAEGFLCTSDSAQGDQKDGAFGNATIQTNPTKRSNWNVGTVNKYTNIYLKPANGDYFSMDEFVVFWCNGNGTNPDARNYKFSITFTDFDDNTVSTTEQTASGYGSGVADWFANSKSVIPVPSTGIDRTKLKKITLNVACTNSPYINIRAFYQKKDGSENEEPCILGKADSEGNTDVEVISQTGEYLKVTRELQTGMYTAFSDDYDGSFDGVLQYDPTQKNFYTDQMSDYQVSQIRIPVYKDIDPKVLQYMTNTSEKKEKLLTPKNLKADSSTGQYIFRWDAVENTYYYEVKYRVVTTEGTVITDWTTDTVLSGTSYIVNPKEKWYGNQIEFEVRAVNAYEIKHSGETDAKAYSSDFASCKTTATTPLPKPEFHFEQIAKDTVIAVLDNPEDYKDASGNYINCNIVFGNLSNISCTPEKGYSTKSFQITLTDNQQYTAQAIPVSTQAKQVYGNSQNTYVFTASVSTNVLDGITNLDTSQCKIDVNFKGFYGDSVGGMKYLLSFTSQGDSYIMSDVVARDDELGIDVAWAEGSTHVTRGGKTEAAMTGFPTDFCLKPQITVRSYLWNTQNFVEYYGHDVAEKLSAEEVKNCQDTNAYAVNGTTATKVTQSIWNDDGSLRKGYVVYRDAEGMYSVKYSTLLAEEENHVNSFVYKKIYKRVGDSDSGYSYEEETDTSKTIPVQPAPVLEKEYQVNEETRAYTFAWDQGKNDNSYTSAVYDVSLTGIAMDGSEVLINSVSGITEKSYTFTDTEKNWNYPKMRLEVVREGTTDNTGVTTKFPSSASKEYEVKIPLSTISKPTVALQQNEDGTANKNALHYQVSWNWIQKEEEKNDLAGYVIKVVGETTETHYYWVDLAGDASVTEENWIDVSDTINEENHSVIIDLSDYAEMENITVSVRTIAKSDSKYYSSGSDGVEREMQIPTRLHVPDISTLTSDPAYQREESIAVSKYSKDGIVLSYTGNSTEVGKMQLCVAVYDEKEDAAYGKVNKTGDATSETAEGYWNSGALETIITKKSETEMTGDLTTATYKLTGLMTDYAGKWLKIAVRASSDNNISSWWTDEDSKDSNSLNYQWIQIPRVKIDTPKMTQSDTLMYLFNEKWSNKTFGQSTELLLKQRGITFTKSEHADGYIIELKSVEHTDEMGNTYYDKQWIYLQKSEKNEYDIFMKSNNAQTQEEFETFAKQSDESQNSSEETTETSQSGAPADTQTNEEEMEEKIVCEMDEAAVYIGNSASLAVEETDSKEEEDDNKNTEKWIKLPYYELFADNEELSEEMIKVYGWLVIEKDKFRVLLPDILQLEGEDTGKKYIYHSEMTVQAVVSEKMKANYESSNIAACEQSVSSTGKETVKFTEREWSPEKEDKQ